MELWDKLSIVMLAVTAFLGLYFLLIFVNPNSPFNPFPPVPTEPVLISQPTGTPPPLIAAPAGSPTLEITFTATPIPTIASEMLFGASSVSAVKSTFIPHLEALGCGWFGVGGTVDDVNNEPITGVVVRLNGVLNGKPIELTTLSGISPGYGKAGYEFYLGNVPLSSSEELYVQLLDEAGMPLSEKVFLSTSADCERNLILVRFKMNR